MNKLLIVDDNPKVCQSLKDSFSQRNYSALVAYTIEEAIECFTQEKVKVVLIDLLLGEESGLDLMPMLFEINPNVKIIIITAHGTIDTATRALKSGAYDYILKPVKFEKLFHIVKNALESFNLKEQIYLLKSDKNQKILDNSHEEVMLTILNQARKIAASNIPVLITGESGTGKELLAEYIHNHSSYANNKLEKINCAAFPLSLLDNELFGHEKGSYTGAHDIYKGVFERSHNGSIFLDEIGDMPLETQVKILRVLHNHEIRRIGGSKTINIACRFIASTNKDLRKLIDEGSFREDLYFRLNTATFHIPPLRERIYDIPLLTDYFIKSLHVGQKPPVLSEDLLGFFKSYSWPGNIRELKNVIQYSLTICESDEIKAEHLPLIMRDHYIMYKKEALIVPQTEEKNFKDRIIETLKFTNFNKTMTAKILGISRATLYNKINEYEIRIIHDV
jgi:DNA-binding NtrC family response regulator